MFEKLKEYEDKGFKIGFYPYVYKNVEQWVLCVLIKGDKSLTFIKGQKGFYNSAFETIEKGLEAMFNFCDNYKWKKKK